MLKVLFIVNIPSPYRVTFFNELGKNCDLTVLFEKEAASDRDDSWKQYTFENFKGIFLKGISLGAATALCFGVKKHLKKNKYDVIVCGNFTSPTGILAIRYMKKKGIPYYLESDGGFAKSEGGWREQIKKFVIPGAKGYFSTGKEHDKYYLAYGADEDKLLRYPFTSLSDLDIIPNVLTQEEKQEYKKQLGILEEKIVLAVGQFIPRKGFDVLLKATKRLDKPIGIYFVGGEPTEEYLKLKEDLEIYNVHFIGFKKKEELRKYYLAADVFALPTREDIWGLVVNEAMAYGLPVVTTTSCVAGIELIENNRNGFLIKEDDEIVLAEKIDVLMQDDELRMKQSKKALETIRAYSIEKMAQRHMEIFSRDYK